MWCLFKETYSVSQWNVCTNSNKILFWKMYKYTCPNKIVCLKYKFAYQNSNRICLCALNVNFKLTKERNFIYVQKHIHMWIWIIIFCKWIGKISILTRITQLVPLRTALKASPATYVRHSTYHMLPPHELRKQL